MGYYTYSGAKNDFSPGPRSIARASCLPRLRYQKCDRNWICSGFNDVNVAWRGRRMGVGGKCRMTRICRSCVPFLLIALLNPLKRWSLWGVDSSWWRECRRRWMTLFTLVTWRWWICCQRIFRFCEIAAICTICTLILFALKWWSAGDEGIVVLLNRDPTAVLKMGHYVIKCEGSVGSARRMEIDWHSLQRNGQLVLVLTFR